MVILVVYKIPYRRAIGQALAPSGQVRARAKVFCIHGCSRCDYLIKSLREGKVMIIYDNGGGGKNCPYMISFQFVIKELRTVPKSNSQQETANKK